MNPASVYVHVPFCARKCAYCDFASAAGWPGDAARFVDAVRRETALRAGEADGARTLFLGGGTPSLLSKDALGSLLAAVTGVFPLAEEAEVSLEANPATFALADAAAWRALGVNRVSVGVQALEDVLLARLGRLHTAAQALEAIACLRRAGFANVSADLMYGLPGQTTAQWRETLERMAALGLAHLSCYALTLSPDTPLGAAVERGETALPGEDDVCRMMDDACAVLRGAGYERYEISNFALPGRRCRHNMAYWLRLPYVGLGPSAHGFTGGERYENERSLTAYCGRLAEGILPERERQSLTPQDERTETIMLRLRLSDGLPMDGFALPSAAVLRMEAAGLVRRHEGMLSVTDDGMRIHNAVLAELL